MYSIGHGSIFANSHVKQSLLQLGMTCVCMPWGDGGRSTLLGMVRTVASMLRSDPNVSVASAAFSTLCALDAVVTPRAPALVLPSRESVDDCANTLSAGDLLEGIAAASAEIAKVAAKETDSGKRMKIDNMTEQKSKVADSSVEDTTKEVVTVSTDNAKKDTPDNEKEDRELVQSTRPDVKESVDVRTEGTKASDNKVDSPPAQQEAIPMEISNVTTSNAKQQVEKTTLPEKQVSDKEGSTDDDSSMGDFPDIIDEEPDEEDRV